MTATSSKGLVSRRSAHSVAETIARLETILAAQGVKLFAVIDHSGEAAGAGLQMPLTKVAIFGNPKAGTPLMVAAPSTAIDLPLKLLIAEDAQGAVWVTYNDPAYLQQRHGFSPELLGNIAVVEKLAEKISE